MSAPAVGVSPEAAAAAGMSAMQAARQTDEQLGITKYVGSHEGFSGTMKYRFTDFIVREVRQPPLQSPCTCSLHNPQEDPGRGLEILTGSASRGRRR